MRDNNEDRFFVREYGEEQVLIVIADGLGGQPGGDVAAQIAIDTISDFTPIAADNTAALIDAVNRANNAILAAADKDPERAYMGCTITLALIKKETVYWVHVGDCRLYQLHDNQLLQITDDQNLAQTLKERKEFVFAKSHNVLDQHLGLYRIEPATGSFTLTKDDILLLCSDGLYLETGAEGIEEILKQQKTIKERGEVLLQKALAGGGRDNITFIVVLID